MSILEWTVLGVLGGFIASRLIDKRSHGLLDDIAFGSVGAFLLGWSFNGFGMTGVTVLDVYSMLTAVVGAVTFSALSRSSSHAALRARREWRMRSPVTPDER